MKHPLEKYLARENLSQNAFAKKHGFHVSNVNRVINGDRAPSVDFAKRLSFATGGKIKWTAFFPESKTAKAAKPKVA